MDSAGGGARRLTDNDSEDEYPAWQPIGTFRPLPGTEVSTED